MSQLTAVLKANQNPGIYRISSRIDTSELSAFCQEHGYQFFYIDGKAVSSKAEFLHACAQAMNFPYYFGNNWDAFEDCITDLTGDKFVLLYSQPDRFVKQEPAEWLTAIDTFRSAIDYWQEVDASMYILLETNSSDLTEFEVLE